MSVLTVLCVVFNVYSQLLLLYLHVRQQTPELLHIPAHAFDYIYLLKHCNSTIFLLACDWIAFAKYYCRRSEKLTGTEMSSPPPVIYEEILDPLAQENLAYRHVQQLQAPLERRGPVYEDIKPDPHTQGNVAYGHVQFH